MRLTTHFSAGSYFLSRARYNFVSSTELTFLARRRAASLVTGRKARSSSAAGLSAAGGVNATAPRAPPGGRPGSAAKWTAGGTSFPTFT